ncbi:unnamed protein product [Acanthosepion pharaonis]|uniref:GON domain-containing protein n=1 Tax=Acanthosepion pharaonis TaxID=158019 RepID=A0A812DID4_ACAPH|nr:unnamed protein product [Sepia pharaonis]
MGSCQNQPCGICEVCHPTESNYTCVKEDLTSCRDIKICNNASSDGHYPIRPVLHRKSSLKVYCHDMNSKYPGDYITLIHDNFSLYPPIYKTCTDINWNANKPGVIFYHKIRLELIRLRVVVKDRTFTNVSCDSKLLEISNPSSFQNSGRTCSVNLEYGTTGDCLGVSCNQRKGIVQIDLRGTGLIVSPSVKWITGGHRPHISSSRSPTNDTIKIVCGGTCGWCSPEGGLFLELKP